MFDPDRESAIFAAQTANLDLYSNLGQAYSRTRLFRLDVLELLSPLFDANMREWLDVARSAAHGQATQDELIAARNRIRALRAQRLGLLEFDDDH